MQQFNSSGMYSTLFLLPFPITLSPHPYFFLYLTYSMFHFKIGPWLILLTSLFPFLLCQTYLAKPKFYVKSKFSMHSMPASKKINVTEQKHHSPAGFTWMFVTINFKQVLNVAWWSSYISLVNLSSHSLSNSYLLKRAMLPPSFLSDGLASFFI